MKLTPTSQDLYIKVYSLIGTHFWNSDACPGSLAPMWITRNFRSRVEEILTFGQRFNMICKASTVTTIFCEPVQKCRTSDSKVLDVSIPSRRHVINALLRTSIAEGIAESSWVFENDASEHKILTSALRKCYAIAWDLITILGMIVVLLGCYFVPFFTLGSFLSTFKHIILMKGIFFMIPLPEQTRSVSFVRTLRG